MYLYYICNVQDAKLIQIQDYPFFMIWTLVNQEGGVFDVVKSVASKFTGTTAKKIITKAPKKLEKS